MVQDSTPHKESLSEVAASVPTTRYNARRAAERSRKAANIGCGITIVGLAALGSLGIYGTYQALNPTNDVTVMVTDKVVKNDGKSSTYLIFTDKGVYENTDSLVNGKWNSSDVYSQIKVGKTYTLHVRGIRNHFMSWYPNILNVKDAKDLKK